MLLVTYLLHISEKRLTVLYVLLHTSKYFSREELKISTRRRHIQEVCIPM